MFVVVATKNQRRWISGIFQTRQQVDEYLAVLAADECGHHLVASVDLEFPFFVVEDATGFRFLKKQQITAESKRLPHDGNRWFIAYRIEGKYRPSVPGADEMGSLPHHHRYRVAGQS
jgi:hypothetical protein